MKLTTNYSLKKPEGADVVNIDDFNYNADIIDNAIKEVKTKVDGLELTAERVSIADPTNKFEATNVEDAILENKTSILELKEQLGNNIALLDEDIKIIRGVL
ncbi:MAG: hypothetical protein J6D47_15480 [Peptostreptococcaceae bacterium]|nr:hypothetical protein [Peptostreptococcaceae bacterium]